MPCFRLSSTLYPTYPNPFTVILYLSTRCPQTSQSVLVATCLTAERVVTCDDSFSVQRLNCDSGVISVQAALYGHADTETCSEGKTPQQLSNTKCWAQGTLDVLKKWCDGKKMRELNTNIIRTSDRCKGIFKYLETTYTCFPAVHLVTCEKSLAHLHCDEGQVIFVYGADYGRRDQNTCSHKLNRLSSPKCQLLKSH